MNKPALYGVGTVAALVLLFPIIVVLVTSVTPSSGIFSSVPSIIPSKVTLRWYNDIFVARPILRNIASSLYVAVGTVVINLVIAAMAGYSLSRFSYPGRKLLGRLVIFTYMFPPILLVLPLYLIIAKVGLVDTRVGLIIAHTTFTVPFSIWLLKGYMDTIPTEIDECARVDGSNQVRTFATIIVPLAGPGLAAAATFTFISSWNEYLFASVILNGQGLASLPIRLSEFVVQQSQIQWGPVMAAAAVALVPATVIFQFLQKQFVAGLTAGAVKG